MDMEPNKRRATAELFAFPAAPAAQDALRPRYRFDDENEIASIEEAVVAARRHWCLTASETLVLHQAAQGESERGIAFRMGCKLATVRRIRKSIGEKSGFSDGRRAVFEIWRLAFGNA